MSAAEEKDALAEIRQEYKQTKKELNNYDSFIDNHPLVCIFGPFFLSLCVVVVAAVMSSSWVGLAALLLFVISMVMLGIFISRSNKVTRINAKLDDIENEVKLFHAKDTTGKSMEARTDNNRDELGLWRDIKQEAGDDSHSGKGGWVLGVIVIVVIASVISVNQANERKQESAERARQTQIIEQQRAKQQQDTVEQRKLDQQDEANRLQQQQNAIDLYNSTKPDSSNYRSSTNCSTSYYGGYTAYTTCD